MAAAPDAGALLEARGVHFSYPGGAPVVAGVSLALGRGRLGAVIGPNGSGKSTLVRLLMGLLAPTRGEVLFAGAPLRAVPRRELARRLAYVPQTTAVTFPFTALEVVITGRSPFASGFHFESPHDCEKARQALDSVDAVHLAERRMTELSGGERQLVTVARALATEPACLVMDEPSAALDLKHRAALIRLLAGLRDRDGLTALVVTQDLQLVEPAFDRVFGMRDGVLVAEGTPREMLRDSVLQSVFDDPYVRSAEVGGRTFVWSEWS